MTINTCMYCTYHCVCMCVCVCVCVYACTYVCSMYGMSESNQKFTICRVAFKGGKREHLPPPRKQDGPWAMLCVLLPIIRLVTQNYVAM